MNHRFMLFFFLSLAAFCVQAQTETRADRSAQALLDHTPQKLFEKRLSWLEQAIQIGDASQMIALQRDLTESIRESIEGASSAATKQSLEAILVSMEGFSFHAAAREAQASKLEVLRSALPLIPNKL